MALGLLDCIELRYGFSPFSVVLTPMQYIYKYNQINVKKIVLKIFANLKKYRQQWGKIFLFCLFNIRY